MSAKIVALLAVVVLAVTTMVMPGCDIFRASADATVRVTGAWDLISPFDRDIVPAFTGQTGVGVQLQYSDSSIADLKTGKTDAVLLGREPTADEAKGLKDYVIAYDAVCIIIDANSYQGGQYPASGTPIRKSAGFTNLTTSDLKGILSYYLVPFGQRWFWRDSYYTYKPVLDLDHASISSTSVWTPDARAVSCKLNLTPGKYDTQTVLYQKMLGIDETELAKSWGNSYSDVDLNAEEEILSVEYRGDAPYKPGSADFPYKLEFASRRVIPVALQHVFINVVSIDGIDPLTDVQSVYDGTYPLSRKIHLLTRGDSSHATKQFADYLLSAAGQQALTQVNYLPLQQTP